MHSRRFTTLVSFLHLVSSLQSSTLCSPTVCDPLRLLHSKVPLRFTNLRSSIPFTPSSGLHRPLMQWVGKKMLALRLTFASRFTGGGLILVSKSIAPPNFDSLRRSS